MIYVLKSEGKGESSADYVTLLQFETQEDAENFVEDNTQKHSDGHKYWTRFDIVKPNDVIEPYAK